MMTLIPGDIEYLQIDRAQPPAGHYSNAVAFNGMIFVSGILGRGPDMCD